MPYIQEHIHALDFWNLIAMLCQGKKVAAEGFSITEDIHDFFRRKRNSAGKELPAVPRPGEGP